MSKVEVAPPNSQHGDALSRPISDETFNFREARFDDPKVTGAQVADVFGAHPVESFVILAQTRSWELESLRPAEAIELHKVVRFFVIKGDGTKRFLVDGLNLEWPREVVTGLTIKRLIGKENDDVELFLEQENRPDREIDDGDEICLGKAGVEKLRTRKVSVTIIVNTRETTWTKKKISFEELVKIAFPVSPPGQCIVYTITYFNGPAHHPEGALAEGASVRVKDRIVFSVKFTDKS